MDVLPSLSAFTVFLAICAIGFLFLMLALVFGEIFHVFEADHDFDTGGPASSALASWRCSSRPSADSARSGPTTVCRRCPPRWSASAAGLIFGGAIYALARFLYNQQAGTEVRAGDLVGVVGRVVVGDPRGRRRADPRAHGRGADGQDRAHARRRGHCRNMSVQIEEVLGETVIVKKTEVPGPSMTDNVQLASLILCDSRRRPGVLRRRLPVQPQLHQGLAQCGRRAERTQTQAARRAHRRLPDGPGRRGAADSAAREGRVPPPERDDDPAGDQAGVHAEGRTGLGQGGRQREDPRRRHVAPGVRRAVPRHDARPGAEGHLPDARRAPAIDPRHADGRGGQQRSPELCAEAHDRGGHRSREDGHRRRRADDPGNQRRRGLPRRARQAAHRRGQARRDDRRGRGAPRREDQVVAGAAGRGEGQVPGRGGDLAVVARLHDPAGAVSGRDRDAEGARRAGRAALGGDGAAGRRGRGGPQSRRRGRRKRSRSRSRKSCAGRRSSTRRSSSRPKRTARPRSCGPRRRSSPPSSKPKGGARRSSRWRRPSRRGCARKAPAAPPPSKPKDAPKPRRSRRSASRRRRRSRHRASPKPPRSCARPKRGRSSTTRRGCRRSSRSCRPSSRPRAASSAPSPRRSATSTSWW